MGNKVKSWVVLGIVAVFAFGAGIFVQDVLLARWSCIHGVVQSQTLYYEEDVYGNPGRLVMIGEQVLCAKDWRITGIHGPKMPLEYKLNPWTPKEEWMPWNWEWKKRLFGEDVGKKPL